jgi:hypothetical protein
MFTAAQWPPDVGEIATASLLITFTLPFSDVTELLHESHYNIYENLKHNLAVY